MLQLIGWLGCLYLVIKAFEIAANPVYRDDAGKMKNPAMAASLLCCFGAAAFALAFKSQGDAFPIAPDVTPTGASDCLANARTVEEITACADAAD